jgi:ribosomal protein S18 acetylase RimI-like enzyme
MIDGAPMDLPLRATTADAREVHALLAAAGRALADQGYANWDPPYPLERVAHDIVEREVWLVRRDGAPIATYTLGTSAVRPYAPAPWADVDAPATYLNRLAVAPALQGQGIGAKCLDAVATRSRALGARTVRCDVLAANGPLCRFYERHGFRRRGTRSHSGWEFACYERTLSP